MPSAPLDTVTPWYRQFWPWFLIALPASVVVASMVTLAIAVSHPDSLAVSDYGRIDELTARARARDVAARELGLKATVSLRRADHALVIDLKAGKAPAIGWRPDRLRVVLRHPSRQAMDIGLSLDHQTGSRYEARPVVWPSGRRYIEILPASATDPDSAPWRLVGELSDYPDELEIVATPR